MRFFTGNRNAPTNRGASDAEIAEAAFDEGEERLAGTMRQGLKVGRDGQLAMEGAMAVFYRWSRRTFADLVKAGREWEEETTLPNVRRRVSLNDEDS